MAALNPRPNAPRPWRPRKPVPTRIHPWKALSAFGVLSKPDPRLEGVTYAELWRDTKKILKPTVFPVLDVVFYLVILLPLALFVFGLVMSMMWFFSREGL